MLHVRRWRGPRGLELASLFQALHHLTSNALFMPSSPRPFPTTPPRPAVFTLLTQNLNYTPVFCSFHVSSLSSSLPSAASGSRRRTPRPKSPLAELVLWQTSRQTSGSFALKPIMTVRSAKWPIETPNYCHITCSCTAAPNLQDASVALEHSTYLYLDLSC